MREEKDKLVSTKNDIHWRFKPRIYIHLIIYKAIIMINTVLLYVVINTKNRYFIRLVADNHIDTGTLNGIAVLDCWKKSTSKFRHFIAEQLHTDKRKKGKNQWERLCLIICSNMQLQAHLSVCFLDYFNIPTILVPFEKNTITII